MIEVIDGQLRNSFSDLRRPEVQRRSDVAAAAKTVFLNARGVLLVRCRAGLYFGNSRRGLLLPIVELRNNADALGVIVVALAETRNT